jgi:hypothetical protein
VQIVATDEHPFYVVDVGWTTADAIQVGQKLVGAGGAVLTVVANQDWKPDGGVVVYNFQVEGDHTYFVGDVHAQGEWVWTHNACDYKSTFFAANPDLKGKVVVHHAIEQQVMTKYPGVIAVDELHSLENLRGIPLSRNSDIHLSAIRKEWNKFYKPFDVSRTIPSKQQLKEKAREIDALFGVLFSPTVKGSS